MRMLGRSAAGLVLLAWGCSDGDGEAAAGGVAGGEEREVTQVRPRSSVGEQLVASLGGQASLEGLTGLRVRGSGVRYLPHEGVRPEDPPIQANSFERSVSIDFAADALRVETSRDIEFLFPGSQQYADVVVGNLGASTQPFFGTPLGALGSDKVASIRRQELLLTPHLLWRSLAGDVTEQPDVELDGVTYHRLVASGGPAPLTLLIDADSGDLARVQTLEHDFYLRDVELEILYSDWVGAGSIRFPSHLEVVRAGEVLFTEDVAEVSASPTFEASAFEFPDGVTPEFDAELYARGELSHQWYYLLDSIGLPFSGVDTSIMPVEVGSPGVAQLVGASHHSFVVEQETGLVLVDAPLYEDRGGALVEFLAQRHPNVPIENVIVSHFHEDHVAGVREVLGRTNASLVVHESTEAFWRERLAAPSTLRPDALSENPREVRIRTVPEGGELELPDSIRPVTVYHLPTSHAADMLLTHEREGNSVFVVDIFSPGNAAQIGAGDLDAALTTYGIPTEDLAIVGGHGGVADYAALQAALP